MSKKKEDPTRIRIWVSRVQFEKIDKEAKKMGKISGNRIIDTLMDDYVKKEDL